MSGKLLDTRVWSVEEKLSWVYLGVASRWVVFQATGSEETGQGERGVAPGSPRPAREDWGAVSGGHLHQGTRCDHLCHMLLRGEH